mgnify:CR=1 FL=1
MQGGRTFIDQMGRMYRFKEPEPLSEPPHNLMVGRNSRPWRSYLRMLGTVIPAFFLMYVLLFLVIGIVYLEPIAVFVSGMCSAPLIALIFRLHKPRLVHVRLLSPDEEGSEAHALPEGGSIRTPMRTSLRRYLVRDDSVLDLPPTRQLWLLFGLVVSVLVGLLIMILQDFQEGLADIGIVLFLLLAIPTWIVGFSLPVLAWWGTSDRLLGIPTRRRDAEAWLMAGMASAFPAFIFNSLVAPEIIPFEPDHWAFEFSLLAVGAPLCEEIFKAMAVALFLPYIKGPKHGFQVGFTVGLGFALIENFQYIGISLVGGPFAASFTILVRGIGSIPGHAVWTAISGTAIGWMATDKELKAKLSWKAKSMAISAIDIAEGIGIDTDGDGDLSGFDGARPTLDEAVSLASQNEGVEAQPWVIIGKDSGTRSSPEPELGSREFHFTYDSNPALRATTGIKTPRDVSAAVALSIAGHSFWNGSSFMSYHLPEAYGMGESATSLVQFSWIIFLVCSVLLIARGVIKGVNSLE